MKKIILALVSLFLLSAYSYPKHKQEIKCTKQEVPLVVDGKTGDWQTGTLHFDSKTGFAYAFSNDKNNLYLRLKMLDAAVQRKALFTGFTVWFDPDGKGKHVLGIVYPQGRKHRLSAGKPGHYQGKRPDFQAQRNGKNHGLSPEVIRMINEHFNHEIPRFIGFEKAGRPAAKGIIVKLQLDTPGHVVYEARIPLKAIFKKPADYLTRAKPFSVILETGYLQIDMSRMQGQGARGGSGTGGGYMGGRQQGGLSRMALMQSMAEPSRLKIKTIVLYQIK